jgi:SAM-dependent methyltransferase
MNASPIQNLEAQKRLLSPVYKGPLKKADEGFRGEIALKFAAQLADEARPPEIAAFQTMFAATAGKFDFIACELDSLAYLEELRRVLGDYLKPEGKYFAFAGNVDISRKYSITLEGIPFNVFPLDEATVYNELLDLIGLERNDLKKLDTAAKLDAIKEAAAKYRSKLPEISFEQGKSEMGPIRIPENRPV